VDFFQPDSLDFCFFNVSCLLFQSSGLPPGRPELGIAFLQFYPMVRGVSAIRLIKRRMLKRLPVFRKSK